MWTDLKLYGHNDIDVLLTLVSRHSLLPAFRKKEEEEKKKDQMTGLPFWRHSQHRQIRCFYFVIVLVYHNHFFAAWTTASMRKICTLFHLIVILKSSLS